MGSALTVRLAKEDCIMKRKYMRRPTGLSRMDAVRWFLDNRTEWVGECLHYTGPLNHGGYGFVNMVDESTGKKRPYTLHRDAVKGRTYKWIPGAVSTRPVRST